MTQVSKTAPLVERLAAQIDKSGECHIWMGARNAAGYGIIGHNGGKILVHRAVYELEVGPIPEDQGLLHRCDNPPCCNTEHLFPGDQQTNMDDCRSKGRTNTGMRNGNAKLTDHEVIAIRAANGKQSEIARQFGTTQSNVSYIRGGKRWANK